MRHCKNEPPWFTNKKFDKISKIPLSKYITPKLSFFFHQALAH
jgi:hypothetical protein